MVFLSNSLLIMPSPEDWIKYYELESHPEGGYFRQTGASSQLVTSATGLQVPLYTNILFLIKENNFSNFHQLKSNEVWYYHAGNPLTVHCIDPESGHYYTVKLGDDISKGQLLQYEVPAGIIFGSSVDTDYSLVSAMVSPGFDFREFALFKKDELIEKFPQHEKIIEKLTAN